MDEPAANISREVLAYTAITAVTLGLTQSLDPANLPIAEGTSLSSPLKSTCACRVRPSTLINVGMMVTDLTLFYQDGLVHRHTVEIAA